MEKKVTAGALVVAALGAGVWMWKFRRPFKVALDTLLAAKATPADLATRQRKRLAGIVAFARARSPYYHALYRNLPAGTNDLSALPVVTKPDLMAHFDEWVTDPAVTRTGVEAFVAAPTITGKLHLGRYAVWTTSGTTGKPGIFVHDQQAVWVYRVIDTQRKYRWLTPVLLWQLLRRARVAIVAATGGHFGMVDWFEQARHRWAWLPVVSKRLQVFSVLSPLGELVRRLNNFQPGILAGYPSIIALLAVEQRAGRLHIAPIYVGTVGEELDLHTREEIEETFHCILRDNYGSSEFPCAAYECEYGWLHVNADWLLLEPVDSAYRPVLPGQPSHTVLITNLANHVQPLIRYDLGDSITVKPDPCPCGFPLPAMRVEGRKADVLHLATPLGDIIAILPLAIGAVVEETPGVRRAQIIQTGHSTLTLRLEVDASAGTSEQVWKYAERRLRDYLAAQGLPSISIVRAPETPQPHPISGKFRQVWSEVRVTDTATKNTGAIP